MNTDERILELENENKKLIKDMLYQSKLLLAQQKLLLDAGVECGSKATIRGMRQVERLRALACEPMRVIAVDAIRAVTGGPDIKGNGLYLSEEIMRGVAEYIEQTDT